MKKQAIFLFFIFVILLLSIFWTLVAKASQTEKKIENRSVDKMLSIQEISSIEQNTKPIIANLQDLRVVGDKNYVRIILVFDKKIALRIQSLDNPKRLLIDFPKADFKITSDNVALHGFVSKFYYGALSPEKTRFVFALDAPFSANLEQIVEAEKGQWQWIIVLKRISIQNFQEFLQKQFAYQEKHKAKSKIDKPRVFRVALDPGHGGIDSGAKGVNGTLEKNVTLAFAKKLKNILEKKANIKVFLTREKDIFLRLKERVEKAHAYGADLFISIHADSIDLPKLRGSTVYTLSDKASDDMAEKLAEGENKVDLIDGLPADEPPEIADILLDLLRRETHVYSVSFANKLVANFSLKRINLIKNPHRYAGFQVLKAADIPSVLIELGYLSNKQDEKLVVNPIWTTKMAKAIALSIEKFAQYREKNNN